MKTSTQIIEEAVAIYRKRANESFAKGGFLTTDYPGENGVNHWCIDPESVESFLRSALSQAMKTAVDEVTPEKEKCDHSEWQECGCLDYNDAIDDMEEKKSNFFQG